MITTQTNSQKTGIKIWKSKGKNMILDAICPECQRYVSCGSYVGIMVSHPAIGVHINVKKIEWEKEFDKSVHFQCKGTGMDAETVFAVENHKNS